MLLAVGRRVRPGPPRPSRGPSPPDAGVDVRLDCVVFLGQRLGRAALAGWVGSHYCALCAFIRGNGRSAEICLGHGKQEY